MTNDELLDLYSDYLISAFGQTTATGLAAVLAEAFAEFEALYTPNAFAATTASALPCCCGMAWFTWVLPAMVTKRPITAGSLATIPPPGSQFRPGTPHPTLAREAFGNRARGWPPMPPNQIAERLIISRATMTGLLDSLERRGYVYRVPHSSDRRMLLIELTEAGRQVAQAFRLVVHQHQNQWLAALNEQEQGQLIEALHRLQAVLADPQS